MSLASSVLPISPVGHQALGFTTGDDRVGQGDKTGDARGQPSWGWSLLGDPSANFFVKKRERRWSDQLCGAEGEEVLQ